jgi:rhodanese-related sulfurtransferase
MSLTKEAVFKKMNDENTVILDILPEDDFKKLHIKGSENFVFGQNVRSFLLAVEKKYGKEKFFITYCANRADSLSSRNAAFVLQEQGFHAEDYPGGIQEWSDAGFPIEGTEAEIRETFEECKPRAVK